MKKFSDKTVIVTGAGSGIGRSAALLFGRAGANVVAVDINHATVTECAEEIKDAGGTCLPVSCDAACECCTQKMVELAIRNFRKVDCLVCSAGAIILRSVALASPSDWLKALSVNVTAAALATRFACEEMKSQGGGAVVFVASICGHKPEPGFATYATSKAALLMLMRSLALDYGASNIRVNAVSPGPVETPGLRSIIEGAHVDWDDWKQSVVNMQCIRSVIQPQDVAEAILFLCSDEARMITGSSLIVDGGITARSASV